MRTITILTGLAFLIGGCGSSDEEDNGNGNTDGTTVSDSGSTDGTVTQDGPVDGPGADATVDAPTGCWECADPGGGFNICQARDTTAPLCVYGDGRIGDTCTSAVHCTTGVCHTPTWDEVGFCTIACDTHWDCPNNGRCINDFCHFLCVNESHCPPGQYPIELPDLGVPPDAPPEYCYDSCSMVSGVTGRACHANQLKAPGCVFGDFRPGDICEPGVSPCQCVYFGTDTLGFCTESCTGPTDCTFNAECVDPNTPGDPGDDYCIYTCGGPAGTDHRTCPGN